MSPYDILGVPPGASDDEIAKAYKRLAKRYHPDLNPGDAAAAEQMGRINRAYDDIKAMRQRGTGPDPAQGGPAWQGPFEPFGQSRSYYYTYRPPKHSPIAVLLAIMVTFFIIRFIFSLLFAGYGGGYYYMDPRTGVGPGGYYGYYQTVPGADQ